MVAVVAFASSGCQKRDTIDCTIYWQTYTQQKHPSLSTIESAFRSTFFDYYQRVNDNTVRALNTTKSDVRSLTIKLASMADALIDQQPDTAQEPVEVRVFIDFAGSYTEEVWSKNY